MVIPKLERDVGALQVRLKTVEAIVLQNRRDFVRFQAVFEALMMRMAGLEARLREVDAVLHEAETNREGIGEEAY